MGVEGVGCSKSTASEAGALAFKVVKQGSSIGCESGPNANGDESFA
jgi:hypothetical protein